jgi:acetolactate synthase-1/2/3 large subunit
MSDGIDVLCAAIRTSGIECVFGLPGTQTVPLFEGFRAHGLRTVLATDELSASFMANGYYRATGRLAALTTIPGPGFTYALTGLAEARLDSAAMLYLVGTPATAPGRAFQLQAIDQRAIARPLVKGCFEISAPTEAEQIIRDACALALSGEPGPVMVQIDVHAMTAAAGSIARILAPTSPPLSPATGADARGIERLTKLFEGARQPVFYLGQGALGCAERLGRVAAALRIPVLTTPGARGIIAEDSDMAMGFDPLRGHVDVANRLLDKSDLIVALGCKLGHNGSAGFELRLGGDRLAHVDASAEVPGANYDTDLPLVARVEDVIAGLEARKTASNWSVEELSGIRASLRQHTDQSHEPVISGSKSLRPAEFFGWLRALLPRNTIVVTDSGQHQILTRRHFDALSERGLIFPSDFQSMGFGLPAAVGAKLGVGKRPVVAIVGDGGFLMSGFELLTARRDEAPLTVFVFNDGYLNQIRMQQRREFGHAHAVELLNPNYELFAASVDVDYVRLDRAAPGQIERAVTGDRPTLVEVLVGDSLAARTVPAVVMAKRAGRAVIGPRLRRWLKASLRRQSLD